VSILIDASTRVIIQGITGAQARFDLQWCLNYGTRVVAGVTPGRGGETVLDIPVYDTVERALRDHPADATVLYVPPLLVKNAVLEAIDGGLRLIAVLAEYVPMHDIVTIVAAARRAGARLIGCNTNGIISPGRSKLGGIGGVDPAEIYAPGRIGVVSRSGGMSAELGLTLKAAGLGISTSVSMGGDAVTGLTMADYLHLFQQDPDTDAIVLFGEPGTRNEEEVARQIASGKVTKPVVALIAGRFQEDYPPGMSFGHAAAMINEASQSASAKRAALRAAGARVAAALEDIPTLLRAALAESH
jgi:succinyl-CoA synthetase alpha subunit